MPLDNDQPSAPSPDPGTALQGAVDAAIARGLADAEAGRTAFADEAFEKLLARLDSALPRAPL